MARADPESVGGDDGVIERSPSAGPWRGPGGGLGKAFSMLNTFA